MSYDFTETSSMRPVDGYNGNRWKRLNRVEMGRELDVRQKANAAVIKDANAASIKDANAGIIAIAGCTERFHFGTSLFKEFIYEE